MSENTELAKVVKFQVVQTTVLMSKPMSKDAALQKQGDAIRKMCSPSAVKKVKRMMGAFAGVKGLNVDSIVQKQLEEAQNNITLVQYDSEGELWCVRTADVKKSHVYDSRESAYRLKKRLESACALLPQGAPFTTIEVVEVEGTE